MRTLVTVVALALFSASGCARNAWTVDESDRISRVIGGAPTGARVVPAKLEELDDAVRGDLEAELEAIRAQRSRMRRPRQATKRWYIPRNRCEAQPAVSR